MTNKFANGVTMQRTSATEWTVYKDGVSMGAFDTRLAATSLATGLVSAAAQLDRLGGRKTAAAEVQVITLTSYAGTDSFSLYTEGQQTVPFVRGTNGTAAAIQAALRTATGDTGLTVAGTTDEGPFTVTFVETTSQPLLQSGVVSGCTLVVTRSTTGGTGV
jgi:hypothetical protein